MNKSKIILSVLSILIIICVIGIVFSNSDKNYAVVLTRDMNPGDVITESDISVIRVGDNIPTGYVQSSDYVVGKILITQRSAGNFIYENDFSENWNTSGAYIPDGYEITSLTVPEYMAAGGIIVPGDKINVYLSIDSSVDPNMDYYFGNVSGQTSSAHTYTVLSGVQVLAISSNKSEEESEEGLASVQETISASTDNITIIFAISQQDSYRLKNAQVFANRGGIISIAVNNSEGNSQNTQQNTGNTTTTPSSGSTTPTETTTGETMETAPNLVGDPSEVVTPETTASSEQNEEAQASDVED